MRHQRFLIGLVAPLVLALAACGGAAPVANTPARVVGQALSLAAAKDINGLTNLACAAQKDKILEGFTGGLAQSGISAEEIFAAMNIDVSKVTVGNVTETGDTASVALGGTMSFSFDQAKLREVMRKAMEAQGQTADEAQLNAAMQMLSGFASQPIPMQGQTMELVRENGTWKVCEA